MGKNNRFIFPRQGPQTRQHVIDPRQQLIERFRVFAVDIVGIVAGKISFRQRPALFLRRIGATVRIKKGKFLHRPFFNRHVRIFLPQRFGRLPGADKRLNDDQIRTKADPRRQRLRLPTPFGRKFRTSVGSRPFARIAHAFRMSDQINRHYCSLLPLRFFRRCFTPRSRAASFERI